MTDNSDNGLKKAMDILSKPENLKNILSLLGNTRNTPSGANSNKHTSNTNEMPLITDTNNNNSEIDPDLLYRVQKLMGSMNSNTDPRINLLYAINPFLSSKRQKALNNCIQTLRISKMASLIGNNGDIFK